MAEAIGPVLVEATFENMDDLCAAEKCLISPDQVRRVIVADVLVDPNAAYLSVPARIIRQTCRSCTPYMTSTLRHVRGT